MTRLPLAGLALLVWALAAAGAQAKSAPEPGRLVFWDYHTQHIYSVQCSPATAAATCSCGR
jgi:hypothetical protein